MLVLCVPILLARLDPVTAVRRWSVVLKRTLRELQGTPCIALEHEPPAKQQIARTRSETQYMAAQVQVNLD